MIMIFLALTPELFCFFFSLPKEHWLKVIQSFSTSHRDRFSHYFNHLLNKDKNLFKLVQIAQNKQSRWFEEYNFLNDQQGKRILAEVSQRKESRIEKGKIMERLGIYAQLYAISSFANAELEAEINAEGKIVEELLNSHYFDVFDMKEFINHCEVAKILNFEISLSCFCFLHKLTISKILKI